MPLIWKPTVVLNYFISRLEGGSIFFFLERWLCSREIVWERCVRSDHGNPTGQDFTSLSSVLAVTWRSPKGSWFWTHSPQLVVLFWKTMEALKGGRHGLLRSALEILKSIPFLFTIFTLLWLDVRNLSLILWCPGTLLCFLYYHGLWLPQTVIKNKPFSP